MGEVLQTAWGLVAHWCRAASHRATSGNISRHWSQPSHIIWLPIIISQDIEANHVTSTDSQLLDQPLPEPQNVATIDELEDQPGIFERKDLLTKVEIFGETSTKKYYTGCNMCWISTSCNLSCGAFDLMYHLGLGHYTVGRQSDRARSWKTSTSSEFQFPILDLRQSI